jgi:hypothetical protein
MDAVAFRLYLLVLCCCMPQASAGASILCSTVCAAVSANVAAQCVHVSSCKAQHTVHDAPHMLLRMYHRVLLSSLLSARYAAQSTGVQPAFAHSSENLVTACKGAPNQKRVYQPISVEYEDNALLSMPCKDQMFLWCCCCCCCCSAGLYYCSASCASGSNHHRQ